MTGGAPRARAHPAPAGRRAWQPLLDGELAARASEAVEAMIERYPPGVAARGQAAGPRLPNLNQGSSGQALLFGYLARHDGAAADRHAQLAELYLDEAIGAVADMPLGTGLFGGFTGVAWTAEHLGRVLGWEPAGDANGAQGPEANAEMDANAEIDQALLERLAEAPWQGHFDLGTGLAGIGVYALERLPRPTAVRCLAAVVEHLAASAASDGRGTAWLTQPELLPVSRRQDEPRGMFDLGVPHGVPGVISLLAGACRVEACAGQARRLLDGAVAWLLSLPRTGRAGFQLGKWLSLSSGEIVPARRLAWCYGDPGVAAALLQAARTAGEERWEQEALAIAAPAARSPVEAAGIVDACLCHGAIGLAHLFNRLYQATGQGLFADAARLWYRRGLDMRWPGEGIAGFGSWDDGSWPAAGGSVPAAGAMEDPGLFTGAAGIALGLLAAVSEVEPGWDRLLRVDIPAL
jgi:hypothetical protein